MNVDPRRSRWFLATVTEPAHTEATEATEAKRAPPRALTRNVVLTVVVAALGYFVDIYDLILFSIVRVPSL